MIPDLPLIEFFDQRPEIRCVMSTRWGGVSVPPFASLNLGRSTVDRPDAVAENGRRFAAAAGYAPNRAARMRQVHGARVVTVAAPGQVGEADGLATATRHLPLLVTVADCLPVFLAARQAPAIAAIHAGWRGLAAKIATRAVSALVDIGAEPRAIDAVVGPSIGPCCFEVGDEVLEHFENHVAGGRRVDLWNAAITQLTDAGIHPRAITVDGRCTRCHTHTFFSARAGEPTGRMVGMIVLRASPAAPSAP